MPLNGSQPWPPMSPTATMLYLLIHHGISAVHRSKEMIEKSEKRFRDLVENSLTGISIIQDDQIVYQNPGIGPNVGHYSCFLTHNFNRNHNRRALE